MVAPNVTQDVYTTGLTSTGAYQYTTAVKVWDADVFSILVIHENNQGVNAINYKVQVATTQATPTASDWSDWIAETSLAVGNSFSQSYPEEAFRWVRIGVLQDTAGEDFTWGISTRREKPGY